MNLSHFPESSVEFFPMAKAFRVKSFLPRQMLEATLSKLQKHQFSVHNYEVASGHIREDVMPLSQMYLLLMNDSELITRLQQLSNCPVLKDFKGRVYRLLPDSEHAIDWHQDLDLNKKLAVSINLSSRGFTGGDLLIRHKKTQHITKIHNNGPGDAIFFEIHPEYEHCVLPVTGGDPKLAVTGWYHYQ